MLSVLQRLGFDTTAGIAATGGDEAFYVELLHDFQADYLDRIAAIRGETDPAVLERAAHDLKALLRMLGETRVAQMAEQWEAALRGKSGGGGEQALVCDALERFSQALLSSAPPEVRRP